jgi:hypothetical protein
MVVSKAKPGPPVYTVGWNQMRVGLDPVEVLTLIDEPRQVKVTRINTIWYYSDRGNEDAHVVFGTRNMRVERWRAPARPGSATNK